MQRFIFRRRKACKHHRTTLRELAKNVKPRFFHLIYHAFISIAHFCEINLRQLVATFNRLPVWKYVNRSWAPHVLYIYIYIYIYIFFFFFFFFFILPLHELTSISFVLQITSRNDREEIISFLESNSLILSVTDLCWVKTKNTNTNDNTYTIIPDNKEVFRHLMKCGTR